AGPDPGRAWQGCLEATSRRQDGYSPLIEGSELGYWQVLLRFRIGQHVDFTVKHPLNRQLLRRQCLEIAQMRLCDTLSWHQQRDSRRIWRHQCAGDPTNGLLQGNRFASTKEGIGRQAGEVDWGNTIRQAMSGSAANQADLAIVQ